MKGNELMARLIVFSDYIKPSKTTHLKNAIDYIATREGAEQNENRSAMVDKEVSQKQKQFIENACEQIPALKDLESYAIYNASPNMASASQFIGEAAELIADNNVNNERYMNYIANRVGVEASDTVGHGLFGKGGPISLKAYTDKMKHVKGNVYRHVIAIKIEDAIEQGYTTRAPWEHLINAEIANISKAMNFQENDVEWAAAFHKSDSHPHVHIMMWSKSGDNRVYQNKNSMRSIKGYFMRAIYKHPFENIGIRKDCAHKQIAKEVASIDFSHPDKVLADLVHEAKISVPKEGYGKLLYGYMPRETKVAIDRILEYLCKHDSAIKPAYNDYMQSQMQYQEYYGTQITQEEMETMFFHPSKKQSRVLHNAILKQIVQNDQHPKVVDSVYIKEPDGTSEDETTWKNIHVVHGATQDIIDSGPISFGDARFQEVKSEPTYEETIDLASLRKQIYGVLSILSVAATPSIRHQVSKSLKEELEEGSRHDKDRKENF